MTDIGSDTGGAWPDDLDPVERSLLESIATLDDTKPPSGEDIDAMTVATWLEAQISSRLVDHTARWLRATHGLGYYTIGSAGHESNAVVASALRPTDPALLHYRSGGFYTARALQAAEQRIATVDAVRDMFRGMLAKTTEPIAGGRHKVFGNRALSIIPQTSTIASHLPRAVGLAWSFSIANRAPTTWPTDSVVVCSFGDGSLNHSTAQGAINWAGHARRNGRRLPLLFVCEDNGLGLSVPTPDGWVVDSLANRDGLVFATADGDDPADVWRTTAALVATIRETGVPGVLHLSTVRFLGHAGTDVESAYRSPADIGADVARDPILGTARLAATLGVSAPGATIDWYLDTRAAFRDLVMEVTEEPELISAEQIVAPLTPAVAAPLRAPTRTSVQVVTPDRLTFAQTINRVLADQLEESDDVVVFGEDVGRKGGVYGVTRGLNKRFGDDRVFDTVLDEQSILGLALGASLNGRLPIPEIQYLAYLHNAEDQLRGEAASLAFFSQRQYVNPMVVRVAGYGYQQGFGGHFHNDNSIAVLRDIPGLVIASPAHPGDAGPMLDTCIEHARATGDVCVFIEPIARYHQSDLHVAGDQEWTAVYERAAAPIGRARHWSATGTSGPATVTIVTWGNGLFLSLRAQRRLEESHGIAVLVVDMRWIAPLPIDDVMSAALTTGKVLVVDETRRTGGVGEGVVAELIDAGFGGAISRVAARDSFVPLGAAAALVLVSEDDIVSAAIDLARR